METLFTLDSPVAREKTQKLVNEFLKLLVQRNMAIIDLFGPEVDWYIQGDEKNIPWLGQRTKSQLPEFFSALWSSTEALNGKIENIIVESSAASITGTFTTLLLETGKVVKSDFAIVMNIRDGFITRYRLFEDSFAISNAMQSG